MNIPKLGRPLNHFLLHLLALQVTRMVIHAVTLQRADSSTIHLPILPQILEVTCRVPATLHPNTCFLLVHCGLDLLLFYGHFTLEPL